MLDVDDKKGLGAKKHAPVDVTVYEGRLNDEHRGGKPVSVTGYELRKMFRRG